MALSTAVATPQNPVYQGTVLTTDLPASLLPDAPPLISVIIRSMDRPTLAQALNAVRAQTHPHIEVLVVNARGGVHSALGEPGRSGLQLRLINQGGPPLLRSDAANAGLDAVQGHFFAFLDDDDSLDPNHLASLLTLALAQPPDTVVYAGVRSRDLDDPTGATLGVFQEIWEEGKLLAGNFIPIHAPLVPTQLLACGVRFDPQIQIYEDWDFWLQLAGHARFLPNEGITATYHLHGQSGAHPLTVDPDFVHQATLVLYRKWADRLGAQALWQLSRLYHVRNLALHTALTQDLPYYKEQIANLHQDLTLKEDQISSLHHECAHSEEQVTRLKQEQALKEEQIRSLDLKLAHNVEQIASLHHDLARINEQIASIYNSRSWRVTAPLRALSQWLRGSSSPRSDFQPSHLPASLLRMLKSSRHLLHFLWHVSRHSGGLRPLLRKVWAIYRVEGRHGILRRLPLQRGPAMETAQFVRQAYFTHKQIVGGGLQNAPEGGIAVIVHAYYPDLFEPIAQALAHIPWSFNLYISVTNELARTQVARIAATLERAAQVDIQITPNRGRDFAPLLITYGAAIRQHRYVLHLHTKKSLYSGRERTEWRDYLLAGLLGSTTRVRQILGEFEHQPKLGVVYPDTFEGLPYWAHTWLQNRGIALSLGARLGIDVSHLHYIDAPMGSMFWARSDALRPLLDLHLDYTDFPEEMGQTDGTLQHTLERFIVLAARHAGYSAYALQDAGPQATLFFSPGRKNLSQYFAVGIRERILGLAGDAHIVSFDIFDTLLVRPWYAADNVFAFLEHVVATRFGITHFARLRKQAEHLARQQHPGCDVGIAQIYLAFPALAGCSPGQADAIMALERETELAMLQPHHEVCDAARTLARQGKRLVLVSDMYLDSSLLHQALARHGLDFFDALYVSNETGARKDTGAMWKLMTQREQVDKKQWLHVGDNEHSDIQRPVDQGFLHPVHVMRAADQFMLFNEEASPWMQPSQWQEGLLLGLIANRMFLPGYATVPIDIDYAHRRVRIHSLHDFGYLTIGPALTAFMAWLLQRTQADGIGQLLYASREGHLLVQAHEQIARHLTPLGVAPVPGAYLLCSRAATGLAAIESPDKLEILLGAHFEGNFESLLSRRYCIEDLTPFTERIGDQAMQQAGRLPEDRARFLSLLNQCFDLLDAEAKTARQRYSHYIQQLIGNRRAALVDIGYGATIQKALSGFVQGIAGGYYFVTTDKAHDIEITGQFAQGCFGDGLNPFHTELPLYQYSLLMEAVLTAPDGQFLGFNANGQPRFKAPGLAQRHFTELAQVHAGALEFLQHALQATGTSFVQLGAHHKACQLPIRQVMEGRWELAFDHQSLHVEDNFSGHGELSIFDFYERKRLRLPGVLD